MKKFLSLLLTLIMVLSLAACGDKGTPANSNEPSDPQSSSEPVNTPDTAEPQEEVEPQNEDSKAETSIPEGYALYVNQGATILYPTDKFKEGMMGGIEGVENDIPWVRLSILGDSFDKQKALCQQEHGSSSDYSLSEITVGEHNALKCVYSDSASYFMEVIIDTSFINDEFWACVAVKVDVPKSQGDLSMLEDETLWEIINSFYFDSAKKYSF